MSAGRYVLILFLAYAAAFSSAGRSRNGHEGVDWPKIAGVALLMGIASADLGRRLAGAKAGETRPGFAACARGTYWLLAMCFLLGALGLSFLAVQLLA
jgi:hypothetical protein